jgi:hypothetical protein
MNVRTNPLRTGSLLFLRRKRLNAKIMTGKSIQNDLVMKFAEASGKIEMMKDFAIASIGPWFILI